MRSWRPALHVTLATALAVTAIAADAKSQASPLPDGMKAKYLVGRSFADRFWLPTGPGDVIQGTVHYDATAGNDLVVQWLFKSDGAAMGVATETHALSFVPTAVCKRAGTTSTLYVVGWSPRTSQVVVEEWVFHNYSLGVASPIGTGGVHRSLLSAPPSLARSVVFVSERAALTPVWDAVCYLPGNALWLLDSGPSEAGAATRSIWGIDLQLGHLSLICDSETYPQLSDHRSMTAVADSTGGFVIHTEKRRSVEQVGSYLSASDPYLIVLFQDANGDGIIDTTSVDDFTAYQSLGWDMKYSEP